MKDKVYEVPPEGDGSGSTPQAAGSPKDTNRETSVNEINAKLDAIMSALGIGGEANEVH